MPIYEYLCRQCGGHFEIRQSVSDQPLRICDECGGPLEKQWSLSGFQFKGAGWYVTDYSKKPGSNGSRSETGEKSSGSESTSGTESASKTKSEAPAKGSSEKSPGK